MERVKTLQLSDELDTWKRSRHFTPTIIINYLSQYRGCIIYDKCTIENELSFSINVNTVTNLITLEGRIGLHFTETGILV